MTQAEDRVDAIVEGARQLQFSGTDERYDSVDLDCEDLRTKLIKVARVRSLTPADLDQMLAEQDKEFRESARRSWEFSTRCRERRDDLRVYYVVNTADRRLTVFARDAQCARHFAHRHGHIQDIKNGRVLVMKEDGETVLRSSGSALGRALRAGYPGVVTALGENVVMAESKKVYTPMTIVE